jgi:hypothetical protein
MVINSNLVVIGKPYENKTHDKKEYSPNTTSDFSRRYGTEQKRPDQI